MSTYDHNVDSKEPFLKTNMNNAGVCSTSITSNASNGNTPAYNGVTASCKPPNKEFDYDVLQTTIEKLRVWLFAITAVAVTGFVILIIVVSCLYARLNYDLNHHTHKPKVGEQMASILEKEELCVPCEDFRLGPSPEEDSMLNKFNRKETPTGQTCCVDEPLELLELLKL
ncbi:unnamed protein product, partial [Candidula unifasciata]